MNFNFKKKYGQNFLQDQNIIMKIATSIDATNRDLIIEIGPGGGALTKELVKKQSTVLAYEIDTDVKKYLDSLENEKVHIIYDDFLKRDILKDIENISYENLFIIGNLPYYITTPIIQHIIDSGVQPKECVFMVQKEVADRFSAKPKTRDYGSITVFLNYYFAIQTLFVVGKNCFYPIPKVDSAVIKLTQLERNFEVNLEKFNTFVKKSFQFKRKNLNNNLSDYDRERISYILQSRGYSLQNRAEDLSVEDFVYLVKEYYKE